MVSIDNIEKEIAKQLAQYTKEVEEEIEKAKNDVSKKAVKELRAVDHPKLTGDYAAGWTRKKIGDDYVIHNKTNYQLTHLLENGHAKVNGGRVEGIPHIEPVEKKVIDEFIDRVEKAVQS
ncbi:HK97 gp10 family phage protein [Arthrobacter citreus]|nr:HK97 gp10 family phage protein [Arthrobacter citreus]